MVQFHVIITRGQHSVSYWERHQASFVIHILWTEPEHRGHRGHSKKKNKITNMSRDNSSDSFKPTEMFSELQRRADRHETLFKHEPGQISLHQIHGVMAPHQALLVQFYSVNVGWGFPLPSGRHQDMFGFVKRNVESERPPRQVVSNHNRKETGVFSWSDIKHQSDTKLSDLFVLVWAMKGFSSYLFICFVCH